MDEEAETPSQAIKRIYAEMDLSPEACETIAEMYEEYPVALYLRALSARLAEVERERDEWKKWLGELLAVIHRDGGHYLGENGLEASVQNAHQVWADTMLQLDEARARVAARTEEASKYEDEIQYVDGQEYIFALARPEETDALAKRDARIRAEERERVLDEVSEQWGLHPDIIAFGEWLVATRGDDT